MVTHAQLLQTIQAANDGGRIKTFAEFIAEVFKDRFIEIYLSDSYEEVSTEQISTNYPAVFCGQVVSAYRECLVINSVFVNKANKLQMGNLMFLSERAIKAINEIDGNGIMQDMFFRSNETTGIKAAFVDHMPQNKSFRGMHNKK